MGQYTKSGNKIGKKNTFSPDQLNKLDTLDKIIWKNNNEGLNDLFNIEYFVTSLKNNYSGITNSFEGDVQIDNFLNWNIIGLIPVNSKLSDSINQTGYLFLILLYFQSLLFC